MPTAVAESSPELPICALQRSWPPGSTATTIAPVPPALLGRGSCTVGTGASERSVTSPPRVGATAPSVLPATTNVSVPLVASPPVPTAFATSSPPVPNWRTNRGTPSGSKRATKASEPPLEGPSRSPCV
ncbi:MAG: hypothetical protein R2716_03390 [Microthrixaceae bacterium]